MGDRRCCCVRGCELGEDNFNDREDGPIAANDPKWKIVAGDWEFEDGTVVGKGVLATRNCHPAKFEHGSYIVVMDLMTPDDNETKWAVTTGDPSDPFHYIVVEWKPTTGSATVSIYEGTEAPANLLDEYTYWGITRSDGTIGVLKVCYAPSIAISAQIRINIPSINVCDDNKGAHCYSHDDQPIGGFAFAEGRFDNWTYEVHWLDDPECDCCPCFCVKHRKEYGGADDFACYGEKLMLSFVSIGEVEASLPDIELLQQFGPGSHWPEKYRWYSEVYHCGPPVSAKWAAMFQCRGIPQQGMINIGSLELLDELFAADPATQIALSWDDEEAGLAREAIASESSCSPLYLVFPPVKVNCAFPAPGCMAPDEMTSPYCSNLAGQCFAECPDIRFTPVITHPR